MNEAVHFVILAAVVYRLTRLVTKDDFPPARALRDTLAGGWRPLTSGEWTILGRGTDEQVSRLGTTQGVDYGDGRGNVESRYLERASWVPQWLADLVSCPWCASGWIALVVTAYAWTVADWCSLPAAPLWWIGTWGAGSLLASRSWA